ncbi:MAG: hypothetical protein HY394_05400 [Candidatus Diapherotrites archaeon]|nr:hypothetical protein [Candidatus Diapherotrites archaeon]
MPARSIRVLHFGQSKIFSPVKFFAFQKNIFGGKKTFVRKKSKKNSKQDEHLNTRKVFYQLGIFLGGFKMAKKKKAKKKK